MKAINNKKLLPGILLPILVSVFTVFLFAGCPADAGAPNNNGNNNGNNNNGPVTTYTVTFNANGATGGAVPNSVSSSAGSSITLPNQNTLVRTGYTFVGWNTNAGGTGDNFAAGDSFTVTGNITLFARWNQITPDRLTVSGLPHTPGIYTVMVFPAGTNISTIQAIDGLLESMNNHVAGGAIMPPGGNVFTMAGRDGTPWGGSGTFPVLLLNSVGSNDELMNPLFRRAEINFTNGFASVNFNVFTPVVNTFTVTFNSNGGSVVPAATVNIGGRVSRPADPTFGNRTFEGWYTDAGFSTAYDFFAQVTADITLFARWFNPDLTFNVGDKGPGGGIIFYRRDAGFVMTDTGERYHLLEVAPADASAVRLRWSTATSDPFIDIQGTEERVGSGRKNTFLILESDPTAPAALAARNYTSNGLTGWFLPSLDEILLLWNNRGLPGINMRPYWYWTSSQTPHPQYPHLAILRYFGVDREGTANGSKATEDFVRAIRAF